MWESIESKRRHLRAGFRVLGFRVLELIRGGCNLELGIRVELTSLANVG